MTDAPAPLDPEKVQAFVANAHGDLQYVRGALAEEPALVNAAWDWGGGDWETALGAAAHMGRRQIALLLLEHGARLDLFAAAMLGYFDIVSPVLSDFPDMRNAKGPHGIPLIEHARAGGDDARAVLELLESTQVAAAGVGSTEPARRRLDGADKRAQVPALPAPEREQSGAPASPARERNQ